MPPPATRFQARSVAIGARIPATAAPPAITSVDVDVDVNVDVDVDVDVVVAVNGPVVNVNVARKSPPPSRAHDLLVLSLGDRSHFARFTSASAIFVSIETVLSSSSRGSATSCPVTIPRASKASMIAAHSSADPLAIA